MFNCSESDWRSCSSERHPILMSVRPRNSPVFSCSAWARCTSSGVTSFFSTRRSPICLAMVSRSPFALSGLGGGAIELFREGPQELLLADVSQLDQRRPERLAGLSLPGQRLLHLLRGDELPGHQDLSQWRLRRGRGALERLQS